MASEGSGESSVSVNLPEPLRRWLDDKATQEDVTREDVLLNLLSAYRRVEGLEEGEIDPVVADAGADPAKLEDRIETRVNERVRAAFDGRLDDAVDDRIDGAIDDQIDEAVEAAVEDALEERLDDAFEERLDDALEDRVDERIGSVESEFRELLEDVRDRVVQVKREADAKSPADHDHPELAAGEDLDAVEDRLASLEGDLGELAERLDAGFDNYEEVLEYLMDTTERLAGRQTRLARALVETREELRALAARDAARAAVDDLKREAGQQGVRQADCGACGSPVEVGLLTRAECPHCSSAFVGVEPATGFFGSHTMEVGDRPALEPGPAGGPDVGVDEEADE